ncbi:MAG: hypothetical protein ACRD0K_28750 [Egibacteraceae bacterium]
MTPTLAGRIQTRIFLLAVVGSLWTLLIGPLLPGVSGEPLATVYRTAFNVLAAVLVLGIGWEFIYHGLQQFRWEKDWPAFFGFLTMINEGLLLWLLLVRLDLLHRPLPTSTFVVHFVTTWIVTWLCANGPMRLFVRWRYFGGRLV